jgi:hypothetical protein
LKKKKPYSIGSGRPPDFGPLSIASLVTESLTFTDVRDGNLRPRVCGLFPQISHFSHHRAWLYVLFLASQHGLQPGPSCWAPMRWQVLFRLILVSGCCLFGEDGEGRVEGLDDKEEAVVMMYASSFM